MTPSSPVAMRLMLVEDERPVARATARHLSRAGFEVTTAHSCAAARQLTGDFPLGVFDIELGDGLGVDLAQELLAEGRVVGLVFYTAATYQVPLRRAARLGPVVSKTQGSEPLLAACRQVALTVQQPESGFDSDVKAAAGAEG